MSKALIIGGSRFVGPEIIKRLLKNGDTVTTFNRGNNYGKKISRKVRNIKGDRVVLKDLQKLKASKYDYIYDMCCFDPKDASLLLKILKPKSHLVFFSSAAVYKKTRVYPLLEESRLGSWPTFGDYGERKAKIEKIYQAYCQKNNLKLTIFRPTYLLGENNYFDRENYFFSRILNNKPILIPGMGDSVLQFSFLDDTAEAFFRIPKNQKKQIEKINIAGNDLVSIKNFILLCGDIVGKKPKLINIANGQFGIFEEEFYDDLYPFPNVTFITSNKKLVEDYGIKMTKLEDGLKKIYKAWLKNWDHKTHVYKMEKDILNKFHTK